jgi:hypothetical protein
MAQVRLVFSYHGYPMRRADEVVRDNITGDDEWQENLISTLQEYGMKPTAVELGTPFPAEESGDWVAVRVPITVTHASKHGGRLESFCANVVDDYMGFYCDSCYWERVKK